MALFGHVGKLALAQSHTTQSLLVCLWNLLSLPRIPQEFFKKDCNAGPGCLLLEETIAVWELGRVGSLEVIKVRLVQAPRHSGQCGRGYQQRDIGSYPFSLSLKPHIAVTPCMIPALISYHSSTGALSGFLCKILCIAPLKGLFVFPAALCFT